jgi:hypothetical protein
MKKNQGAAREIGFLFPEKDFNDSNSGGKSVWPHPRQRKRAKNEGGGQIVNLQLWTGKRMVKRARIGGKLLDYTTNTR